MPIFTLLALFASPTDLQKTTLKGIMARCTKKDCFQARNAEKMRI
jgi:hypothetical protein